MSTGLSSKGISEHLSLLLSVIGILQVTKRWRTGFRFLKTFFVIGVLVDRWWVSTVGSLWNRAPQFPACVATTASAIMAAIMQTPTTIIKRFRLRHHLAFSYCASSTGASLSSRSCAIDALLPGRSRPLSFFPVPGHGGRGRTAATNQPMGKTNPTVNSTTWMFLRLGVLETTSRSRAGAMNRLLRFGTLLRCCHRCGDQVCETLARGAPRTSTRLISERRTRVMGTESFRVWPKW